MSHIAVCMMYTTHTTHTIIYMSIYLYIYLLLQVVPLFTIHHLENSIADSTSTSTAGIHSIQASTTTGRTGSAAAGSGVGGGGGGGGDDDIVYIRELMMYLPVAYLCNDLIELINFLRDCPILSTRVAVYIQFNTTLQNICLYIIQQSGHIRARGRKYIQSNSSTTTSSTTHKSSTGSGNSSGGNENVNYTHLNAILRDKDYVTLPSTLHTQPTSTDTPLHLDSMYAQAVVKVLVPHILAALDRVYDSHISLHTINSSSGSGSNSSGSTQKRDNNTAHTFTSLPRVSSSPTELKAVLSPASYHILLACWKLFDGTTLLPTPTVASTSTTTAATTSASANAAVEKSEKEEVKQVSLDSSNDISSTEAEYTHTTNNNNDGNGDVFHASSVIDSE